MGRREELAAEGRPVHRPHMEVCHRPTDEQVGQAAQQKVEKKHFSRVPWIFGKEKGNNVVHDAFEDAQDT